QTISKPTEYYTGAQKWICSCSYYLTNRFMICKHLVKAAGGDSVQLSLSNESESFNSMVDELKYLVTNLKEEIVKGNTHHLQA
ncbi:27560_t:CDS:2, partial [Gigaspora margarita]